MFFSKMGHRHCNHAAEKDARVYPSRDVATQFAKFESGGLQHLGYIQERVYHSQIHHVKELNCWKNVCRGSGGCWMTPSSRQRLHKKISSTFFIWTQCISQYISIVVWMHVFVWMVGTLNINFEPLSFCRVLFVSSILVPLNVIDINMCKVLILVWNVLLLCLRLSHGMVAT